MKNHKVLLLDANASSRTKNHYLLQCMQFETICFEEPNSVYDAIRTTQPDTKLCLIVDESAVSQKMGASRSHEVPAVDVLERLSEQGIMVPTICVNERNTTEAVVSAMTKGAVTVLEKPLNQQALNSALIAAFCASSQFRRRLRINKDEFTRTRERLDLLTRREGQIVKGILADMTNSEIAEEFSISVKTVELYRSKALSKLEARNAAHLVRMVMTCEPTPAPYT